MNPELQRLEENGKKPIPLEQWGPYLSERQWGTVREDYSHHGDAWGYFPFEQSHYRTYLWGEDGIAGISDFFQNLCFSMAFWNGKDHIIKERLFGLINYEGNHGEDVKELYYYLDNTPTHYYMEYLYKYPQNAFPYEKLKSENKSRSRQEPEYEILDTGIFDNDAYFDAHITYAKHNSTDISIRVRITNRGKEKAPITVIPTLWFYNRWQYDPEIRKPSIILQDENHVRAAHHRLDSYFLYFEKADQVLFTENETNFALVHGTKSKTVFTKDAINNAIVNGKHLTQLKRRKHGTKFSPVYSFELNGGESKEIYLRLSKNPLEHPFAEGHQDIFKVRKAEADGFYDAILTTEKNSERRNIQRQALAGL
ncbi:MAG: glucosidase, partial [Chitinophagaceae bacterium]